jgi:hypothetical protein
VAELTALNDVEKEILERLRRIYLDHYATFVYEGPVLGLAIVICAVHYCYPEQSKEKTMGQLLGE